MMLISVLCFGVLGVGLRFASDSLLKVPAFPVATFLVNVVGCFLAGWIFTQPSLSPVMRTSILIGLCGGLTTFSTLILQCLQLMRDGMILKAFIYLCLSLTLGFLAAWLGLKMAQD